MNISIALIVAALTFSSFTFASTDGQSSEIRGQYKTALIHDGNEFFQFAKLTLRTVNTGGQLKISGNLRVFFGAWESNEYISYEYPEIPYNVLTGQLSIKHDGADISMTGILEEGKISGDWFSTQMGKVGDFTAVKTGEPTIPEGAEMVRSLSGFYKGRIQNTNPQSRLPEKTTMSFVTTQDTSSETPQMKISGNVRFYIGDFDSQEYIETNFVAVQFNFFSRYLTARTAEHGLTFKGIVSQTGVFTGDVFSDGLGEIGKVEVQRQ